MTTITIETIPLTPSLFEHRVCLQKMPEPEQHTILWNDRPVLTVHQVLELHRYLPQAWHTTPPPFHPSTFTLQTSNP